MARRWLALAALVAVARGLVVVDSGYSWAENLAFDGLGRLFVSDLWRGEIRCIMPNGSGGYTSSVHVSGLSKVLGLSPDAFDATVMLGVGDANGKHVVFSFSGSTPGSFKVIAELPKLGNGFRVHQTTGLVYTSSEGDNLPGDGEVFEMNVTAGTVRSLKSGLWSADGLFIDENKGLLYVGELISKKIWVYDLVNQAEVGMWFGLGSGLLDDFTLSPAGDWFVGADWWNGSLVLFPTEQTGSAGDNQVLEWGMRHTTSARWGVGPGFASTSLFITEGSGLFSFQSADRVYEFENAASYMPSSN